MAAVISSISPLSGAPGAAITVLGSGFDATAQTGCPVLAATTFNNSGSLGAAIPPDIIGPAGGSTIITVWVQNADGSYSNIVEFTVLFPAIDLQAWTSIDQVVAEVPQYTRGGLISDATILNWIKSISQTVSSCLLRRGLPLDPTQWQQATPGTAAPSPTGVLELISRYGAAARLATAISSQFSAQGEWGLAKNLQAAHITEFNLLQEGAYDKLFLPTAATVEAGQLVATSESGRQAFRKDQVF